MQLLSSAQPFTSSNSTSKINVAFGGMTPPTPRAPLLAAPIDERLDALDDLAILLRPDHWLGHVGQVKKGFNPDIRCRLLPPLTKGLVFVVCEDGERDVFVHASI